VLCAMSNKSEFITYLLWLTCGWLGIHHLYLRRYRHAFVWLWTLGGCCGLGWVLEFWRLSCYVDMANNAGSYKRKTGVSFSWKSFSGELLFSMLLGVLSVSAIPKDFLTFCPLLASVAAVFIATGLYQAADYNVGKLLQSESKLQYCCKPQPGAFLIIMYTVSHKTALYICL